MTTRRDRFRQYMAKLSASSDPARALEEGLYVEHPAEDRSVAAQIVQRLDLEPGSSHLLVGGVGSGKTTQLLMTQQLLTDVPDIQATFVDIAKHHDLARLRRGVLIVLTGLEVSKGLKGTDEKAVAARKHFKQWAHGWTEWVEDFPDDEPPEHEEPEPDYSRPIHHNGVLIPPESPLAYSVREPANELKALCDAISSRREHIVVLFDSLDRVNDISLFNEVVEQDVRAIRMAGIGVVMVGPLRCMFGAQRSIVDKFDNFYHQPAIDVQKSDVGHNFMLTVIRRRVAEDVMSDAAACLLVRFSGGILRDLINLARAAGEEAYVAGSEKVASKHVDVAADSFGRTLMLGLDAEEIEVLQRLRKKGMFVQTSDKSIALLTSRRIIEYGRGGPRFAVHPTIAPLLEELDRRR